MCREFGIPVINILDEVEALGETGRAEMFMDLGHLTPKGDRIVGELVAKGLTLPTDARSTERDGTQSGRAAPAR
jgi:hypothetical protein